MHSGVNEPTIQDLIKQLQDANPIVRIYAGTVLGSMGPEAVAVVPVLIGMLESGEEHDQRLAALTLGEIGPAAEAAIPSLLQAASSDNEGLSDLAIAALEQIDLVEDQAEAA